MEDESGAKIVLRQQLPKLSKARQLAKRWMIDLWLYLQVSKLSSDEYLEDTHLKVLESMVYDKPESG